jgi:peptide/nickel transport system permease protein
MITLLRDRFSHLLVSPFFRAARANGYSLPNLFHRVLLSNSWSTLVTAWINQISLLIFSTVIVEYVFSFRGLGTLLVRSIQSKDLPVLSGIILLNGVFFLVVHTLANLPFRVSGAEADARDLAEIATHAA